MSLNKILEKIELSDIIVAYVGTDLPLVWELTSKRRTLLKKILESSGLSDIVVEYVGTGSYIVWASTAKVFEECYQRYFERTHWTKLPLKHHPDRRSWLDYEDPLPYRMPVTVHDTFYTHAMRSMNSYNTWRQFLPTFVPFGILQLSDPVHFAARCGSLDVMKRLMQACPEESYAATVDLAAANGGNLATLKYVCEEMNDSPHRVRFRGYLREETLLQAAAGGTSQCLDYAQSNHYRTGRNRLPEIYPSPSAFEALDLATLHGNEETAFHLLRNFEVKPNENNPNDDPDFGPIILAQAVESGKLDLVRCLVEEHGCPIHQEDGYDLVAAAAKSGNVSLLEYLFAKGLHFIEDHARCGVVSGKKEVLEWFRGKNIPIGTDALESAACRGEIGMVKWLLEKYPILDKTQSLICAVENGNLEIVKLLVQENATLDSPTRQADTIECAVDNPQCSGWVGLDSRKHADCAIHMVENEGWRVDGHLTVENPRAQFRNKQKQKFRKWASAQVWNQAEETYPEGTYLFRWANGTDQQT